MNVPPSYQMPPPSDAPSPHKSGVPGWAKWVIGCGAMLMCCCPIGGAILFPVFSQAKLAAKTSQSLSNLKQLTTSWIIYSVDYDDKACSAEGWNTKVVTSLGTENMERLLIDPLLDSKSEKRGYGLNAGTAGTILGEYEDEKKVIVFGLTTNPGKDALIAPDTLRKASSFPFRTIWATADGAVTKALIDEAQRLQWKPVLMKK